jgi:hypothetical protein
MSDEDPRVRARRERAERRKDRLIQTRVAEDLEQVLKREAARRRLTVSHLIRNTLEDAFTLVGDVTADVGQLVTGSVELAAAVSRDARRLASIVRGEQASVGEPPPDLESRDMPGGDDASTDAPDTLSHVYGWNRVIANRPSECVRCGNPISRGDDALVGLSDEPGPRTWLCVACGETL